MKRVIPSLYLKEPKHAKIPDNQPHLQLVLVKAIQKIMYYVFKYHKGFVCLMVSKHLNM